MLFKHSLFTALGMVSMVAACAQTAPKPEPIMAEPIFNKVGEPTGQCTNGYVYNTQVQQCEPPTECHPDNTATGSNIQGAIPCPPPGQTGGGGNNGGNPGGNTGGSTGGNTLTHR